MKCKSCKIFVSGGLGNQLFALNFAHFLANLNIDKITLVYALDSQSRKDRQFHLEDFLRSCKHRISVTRNDHYSILFRIIDKFNNPSLRIFNLSKLLRKIFGIVDINLGESNAFFNILEKKTKVFFRGFYISNFFTNETIDTWIQELIFYTQTINLPLILEGKYSACHIRRGDYKFTNLICLNFDYYKKIHFNYSLLVSTDNEEIPLGFETFPVSRWFFLNQLTTWQSFKLLSNAAELAIANSTFSWWAGQIALRNGADVFAPLNWYKAKNRIDTHVLQNGFSYVQVSFD